MKTAFVQDWFTVDGGAEKVSVEILKLFPEADVFSIIDFLNDESRKNILQGRRAQTSFLQKLPFVKKHYRWFLPLFPYAIESLDLGSYDLIISSSYAVAKGVKKGNDQRHLCYCHTPMRYAWDLEEEYIADIGRGNIFLRMIMRQVLKYLRKWDLRTSSSVDCFIANSDNVRERIARIYGRDSTIIHPPVDIDKFFPGNSEGSYYFTASRLVPYKKVDLIAGAFAKMPQKKLYIAGDGPMLPELKKLVSGIPNVELLGFISRDELIGKMQSARAFINASNEDFGISPIEAMACGVPVIAYASGGILESTEEGKTAVYFREQSEEAIRNAVLEFEGTKLNSKDEIRASVLKFANPAFRRQFLNAVEKCSKN